MTTNNRKRSLRKSGAPRQVQLTVYQGGQAVIRESRELALVKGKNSVQLDGLPTAFVENSLVVLGAQGPGEFNIGSSSYEPANMSGASILQKAIGTKVTLIEPSQQGPVRTSGILKFVLGNQVVIEQDGTIVVVPLTPKFEVGELPEGLASTPSLVFEPSVSEAGKYQVRFLYEADGINWASRYNAFLDQKAGKLTRFECVVDITNQSGLQIDDGEFKLFTGANYGTGRRNFPKGGARAAAMSMSAPRGGAMMESAMMNDDAGSETVGEQKLFVLPDTLSIGAAATKTCNLFLAQDIPVQVELYLPVNYYGYNGNVATEEDADKLPVMVRLRIKNDDANNLGKDMPAGEVAFFVYDSAGTEQKVDSASVEARAKGEPFKLELRKPSADVKATRRLTFLHQDQPEPEPEVVVTPEGGLPEADDSAVEGGPMMTMGMRPAVVATAAVEPEAGKKKVIKPLFREEEREVTIYNYKGEDVEVLVSETFPEKSEFIKRPEFVESATIGNTGTLRLTVPANGKATASYRIKYRIN